MNPTIKLAHYDEDYVTPATAEDASRLLAIGLYGLPDMDEDNVEEGYNLEGVYGGLYFRKNLKAMALQAKRWGFDVIVLPQSEPSNDEFSAFIVAQDAKQKAAEVEVIDCLRALIVARNAKIEACNVANDAENQLRNALRMHADHGIPAFPFVVDEHLVRLGSDAMHYVVEKVTVIS